MTINLTATPSMQNGQVAWSLCNPKGICGGNGTYPSVDFDAGAPASLVQISINDPNHLGITFAPGQSAMSVQPGYTCPQGTVWNTGVPPQLTEFYRSPDGSYIQFNNANSTVGAFTYKLSFVNGFNQPVTSIDPIIRNGGTTRPPGGGGLTRNAILTDVGIALVVSLIVSLIVAWFVASRVARSGPR
jgi:hypothetical protein